jgi:hypothetical protein
MSSSSSSVPAIRRLNALTGNVFSDPSAPTVPCFLLAAAPCATGAEGGETKGFDHFSHVKEAPPDEIFNTGIRYRADTNSRKVDLGVGAYRTDEGKPLVLSVVRKAEALIAKDTTLNKEYGSAAAQRVRGELSCSC